MTSEEFKEFWGTFGAYYPYAKRDIDIAKVWMRALADVALDKALEAIKACAVTNQGMRYPPTPAEVAQRAAKGKNLFLQAIERNNRRMTR